MKGKNCMYVYFDEWRFNIVCMYYMYVSMHEYTYVCTVYKQ